MMGMFRRQHRALRGMRANSGLVTIDTLTATSKSITQTSIVTEFLSCVATALLSLYVTSGNYGINKVCLWLYILEAQNL